MKGFSQLFGGHVPVLPPKPTAMINKIWRAREGNDECISFDMGVALSRVLK